MVTMTPEQQRQIRETQQTMLAIQRRELEQQKADLERRGLLPTTYSKQPPRQQIPQRVIERKVSGGQYTRPVSSVITGPVPVIPIRPSLPPVSAPMVERSTMHQPVIPRNVQPRTTPQVIPQSVVLRKLGGR